MDSEMLRSIKEEEVDMNSVEGAAGEQTLTSMTMCEEIEGLLKINMNKVNDETNFKKANFLADEGPKIMGKSRQEVGN